MGNYTKAQDRRRQIERKEGVERFTVAKSKYKGVWYIVNVPDYDNDAPKRIISIGKYRDAKEAQSYYEAWISTHRPSYEQRLVEKEKEAQEARERKERRLSTDPEKTSEVRNKILLEKTNASLKEENERLKNEARAREAELKAAMKEEAERKNARVRDEAREREERLKTEMERRNERIRTEAEVREAKLKEQLKRAQEAERDAKREAATGKAESRKMDFFEASAKYYARMMEAALQKEKSDGDGGKEREKSSRREADEKRKAEEESRQFDREFQTMHRTMDENDRVRKEEEERRERLRDELEKEEAAKKNRRRLILFVVGILISSLFIVDGVIGIIHNRQSSGVVVPEENVLVEEPAVAPNDSTFAVPAAEDSTTVVNAETEQDAMKMLENASKEVSRVANKVVNLVSIVLVLISIIMVVWGFQRLLNGDSEGRDTIKLWAFPLFVSAIILQIIKALFL